jgi:hypothetical protein
MEAAKAGDQMSNVVAAREQQARDTASQRNFMYDELRQKASEGEAARQVQYAGLANQQYEANLRANQGYAQMQQQMQMEDARRRDQGRERAIIREDQQLLRGDRLSQNAFQNDFELKKLRSNQDRQSALNELSGARNDIYSQGINVREGQLKVAQDALANKEARLNRSQTLDNELLDQVKDALDQGISVTELLRLDPRIYGLKGVKALFDAENNKNKNDPDAKFNAKYKGLNPNPSQKPDRLIPSSSNTNATNRFRVVPAPK